jgi:hypothetical protein
MPFNPLTKLEYAKDKGQIPNAVYQLIIKRFHIVADGISRIEKASGLDYPTYYVEPNLVITTSKVEYGQFGIFFARTVPVVGEDNHLDIVVQLTAPLIAYGLVGSVHAILAHELMHYLSLMSRVLKMNIISDEIPESLFEEKYSDFEHLLEARVIFKHDRSLINHIDKKFPEGFMDPRLEEKVIKHWMNKHLPTTILPVDANIVRIPIELMAKLRVDQVIREKIIQFENTKVRSKKSSDYV